MLRDVLPDAARILVPPGRLLGAGRGVNRAPEMHQVLFDPGNVERMMHQVLFGPVKCGENDASGTFGPGKCGENGASGLLCSFVFISIIFKPGAKIMS